MSAKCLCGVQMPGAWLSKEHMYWSVKGYMCSGTQVKEQTRASADITRTSAKTNAHENADGYIDDFVT